MIDVSIIIVSYNTKEILQRCLSSITEFTSGVSYEIIVVDNASSDTTIEMVKSYFPNVILLKNKHNLGFGKANNLGVKIAKGEYIFLLNSDTQFLNNAIPFFHEFMINFSIRNNIGMVGTELLNSNFELTHSSDRFPVIWDIINRAFKIVKNKNNEIINNKNKDFYEVEYITGANLFIKRSLFNDLGGFDEDYFMYYEETDLQYRISKKGFKRVLISGPIIVHLQGKSFDGQIPLRKIAMEYNGFFLYHKKNTNLIYYLLIRIFFITLRLPVVLLKTKTMNQFIGVVKIFFYNPKFHKLNL